MLHIILGLFFLALGIWGIYDEYYYVADIVKAGLPIWYDVIGLLATLAGFVPPKTEEEAPENDE